MMNAYDEVYLGPAQINLGTALDYAAYGLGMDPAAFFKLFVASGLADRFGCGDYELITGCSGIELVWKVLDAIGSPATPLPRDGEIQHPASRSPVYWCGWSLAYFQWKTALTFAQIVRAVPIEEIIDMYEAYHEMDIRQFCDRMTELYRERVPQTTLQRARLNIGLSQTQLAEASGIPVRSIQQYEQRQKSLNRAAAETLFALAQALNCEPKLLLERL